MFKGLTEIKSYQISDIFLSLVSLRKKGGTTCGPGRAGRAGLPRFTAQCRTNFYVGAGGDTGGGNWSLLADIILMIEPGPAKEASYIILLCNSALPTLTDWSTRNGRAQSTPPKLPNMTSLLGFRTGALL